MNKIQLTTGGSKELKQSLLKHFLYMFGFSKESVEVQINGEKFVYGNYEEGILSLNFFRSVKCVCCGNCCKNFPLIWDEQDKISKSEKLDIKVNGKTFSVYYLPSTNKGEKCQWLGEDNLCKKYKQRTTLCRVPHIFVNQRTERIITMSKRQYNRMHTINCQATVEPFDYTEFKEVDIPIIQRLKKNAEYYGVKTYYTDILNMLEVIKKGDVKSLIELEKTSQKRSIQIFGQKKQNRMTKEEVYTYNTKEAKERRRGSRQIKSLAK